MEQLLRKCSACNNVLILNSENFYKDKAKKHGYGYGCKKCQSKRIRKKRDPQKRKEYYEKNKQKIILNSRKSRFDKRKGDINYKGSVYLLECKGYYKIGCSKKGGISGRIARLRSGNPFEIKYLFHYDVADRFKYESDLHIEFNSKRIHSERFKLNKKDIKYIHEYLSDK